MTEYGICDKHGVVPKIENNDETTGSHGYKCPYCTNDLEPAMQCECGEYYEVLVTGIPEPHSCPKCRENIYKLWRGILSDLERDFTQGQINDLEDATRGYALFDRGNEEIWGKKRALAANKD